DRLGVSLDETTSEADVRELLGVFLGRAPDEAAFAALSAGLELAYPEPFERRSRYLTHAVFNSHHSEHELLRYMKRLESRDLSLTTSMIPRGSCTMKLNATAEMLPLTWPQLGKLHPFAPAEQARGYARLFSELEAWLAEI